MVDRFSLPRGKSQAVLQINSNQASQKLYVTITVEVLPTFHLKIVDAKNNRLIAKAKSLSRETQTDGRIQISDTHLAEVQGIVSSKGYLDQSFFVPLTHGNQRVVEKTVRLTPIPRKTRTIRNRDLDFPTEIALSGGGNFAYVINSQRSTVSRITVDTDEVLSTLAILDNSRVPKDIIIHPITGDILVANSFVKPIKLGMIQFPLYPNHLIIQF